MPQQSTDFSIIIPFLTWFDQEHPFINGKTLARNENIGLSQQNESR